MKEIFIVKLTEIEMAHRLESIILSLPEPVGILFAGVKILPGKCSGKITYSIVVGCKHSMDTNLIDLVVRKRIKEEVPEGENVSLEVYRGTSMENYA